MSIVPRVRRATVTICCIGLFRTNSVQAQSLADSIQVDYDTHLAVLFDHFHRNPELSLIEFETAARMAAELRAAGFEVTEGVGGAFVWMVCICVGKVCACARACMHQMF